MEKATLPESAVASAKTAKDCRPYLIPFALSFLAGAAAFLGFLDAKPASPPFDLISILLAAYGVGLFSAIRLVRSANPVLAVIGLSGMVIQSMVMLALVLLLGRVT